MVRLAIQVDIPKTEVLSLSEKGKVFDLMRKVGKIICRGC